MSSTLVPDKVTMARDNDNAIDIRLYDTRTKTYFDETATVISKLYDYQANEVAGASITLTHVADSVTGDFQGKAVLAAGVSLGTGYTFFIEATQGAAHNTWRIPCEVVE